MIKQPVKHKQASSSQLHSRGMTLIELLVIIMILVSLLALALPQVRPAMESRKLREAARLVNAYTLGAQARAAETGRPAGLWLERNSNLNNACFDMYIAEVPLPYSGDTTAAGATLVSSNATTYPITVNLSGVTAPTSTFALYAVGDLIRFNNRNPLYQITEVNGTEIKIAPQAGAPAALPPYSVNPVPFQIFRKPIKSAGSPQSMPNGTTIDLSISGTGADGTELNSTSTEPVIIMFQPTGAIDRVYIDGVGQFPLNKLHLMVGKTAANNLLQQNAHWISIEPSSGALSTSENVVTSSSNTLTAARAFARSGQGTGGG